MKTNYKLKNNIINLKAIFVIYIFISLVSTPIYIVHAQVMTSTTYKLQSDSVNFGGVRSGSASYNTEDTIGEVSTGNLTGASYNASIGYQQPDSSSGSGNNNGGGNNNLSCIYCKRPKNSEQNFCNCLKFNTNTTGVTINSK